MRTLYRASPIRPGEQIATRAGGAVLVAAATTMFAGGGVPFLTSIGGWYETSAETLEAIAQNPTAWRWANGLIAVAAAGTAVGLGWISDLFGQSRALARAGLVTFVIAASADMASRIFHMTSASWVLPDVADTLTAGHYDALYRLSAGWINAFIVTGLVSLILYGLAARQSGATSLGTTLLAFGIVGLVMQAVGAAIPAVIYVGTAALGTWAMLGAPRRVGG